MAELKKLDPVQGLVDYIQDIKPYHTKIIEVLVEYVHSEPVDVTILDQHNFDVIVQRPPGHFENINTDPNLPPNWQLVPGSLLSPGELFKFDCDSGFDTTGYSAGNLLVTSPNPAIPFTSFPAINTTTNSFIVNGNVIGDVKIGDIIQLRSTIENFSKIVGIYAITPGIAGTASFDVLGDVTGNFVPGFAFVAIDANTNNGSYTTTSSSFNITANVTTILVDQSIVNSVAGGMIGLTITGGMHTGSFTVSNVVFNEGTIDSRTNPTDGNTLNIGNNPHTTITVTEPLVSIPPLTNKESYSVQVLLTPIQIILSLSYSRASKTYDVNTNNITQIPDEGVSHQPILGITTSTVINGIPVPDSGKITLGGDFRTSNVFVGDTIQITQSIGNSGIYTITSITYNTTPANTTFGVSELLDDPTINGFGIINIPSNVFLVNGDRTSQFMQGKQFTVFGGSFEGTYTILRSDFSLNVTRVRVVENIFNIGVGSVIINTVGGFQVPGNQLSKYIAGSAFDVIGSPQNDGSYIVDVGGATFDVTTGLSTIPVSNTLNSIPGGELHITIYGELRQQVYGYDEFSPLCGLVPDTIISVYFNEMVKFTGMGLQLTDELIAYNLENTDGGGFVYPIMTIPDSITPVVPFQLNAPITPSFTDLWFDTTNKLFRQWNGYEWGVIKTANWFDTTANMLYYRTIDSFVDTGWVLDSLRFPGYSDVIPAVGSKSLIHTQLYGSSEISPGVPTTTFILSVSVPNIDPSLLKITVNGIAAGFTLDNATTFTVTSPPVQVDDIIVATVFDNITTETNAHVNAFETIPHMVLHRDVLVDSTNNAYIISGGNFIDRFNPSTLFAIFDTSTPNIVLGSQQTISLPILAVDSILGNITIPGNYAWLFISGRVFQVNPSDQNYNNFSVQTANYNATANTTTINVIPLPVESTNTTKDPANKYFYNPPISVINIDNVTNVITISGKVTESFPVGIDVLIENSTVGNNNVWVVSTTNPPSYDNINNQTNITVTGNIPDSDNSGTPTIRYPIFQNYSKNLGEIIGAVFDSQPNGIYNTSQPKTIILPSSPVDLGVNAIEYNWIGPVRFNVVADLTDNAITTIPDMLHLGDELTGGTLNTLIIDTNAITNTFTVHYVDVVTGNPINLSDFFSPGTIFSVVGSYGQGLPSSIESNDARYVVSSVVWDYNPALSTGTGNTIVTIETNFNKIPPYNSFDVVSVSNNGTNFSTITLLGDHVTLFNTFISPIFRVDQPLVSVNQIDNLLDVTSVALVGGNTVLTVNGEFIDVVYTGPIGIIEVYYRANIYFDITNTTSPWIHGSIVIHGSSAQTLTTTSITDDLMFGWGNILSWNIVDVSQLSSTVSLRGDYSAVILPNDLVTIVGSQNIDGKYSIVNTSYNNPTDISTIIVANNQIPNTPAFAPINVTILAVSNTLSYYFDVDGNHGDHIDFLRPGLSLSVINSSSNNGNYTIINAVDIGSNVLRVFVVEQPPANDSSGDVQYTKRLAGKLEMDSVDITSWFQYNIIVLQYSPSQIIVRGDITTDVFNGQTINILGTSANNGPIIISTPPIYDAIKNISTILPTTVLSPGSNTIVELPSLSTIKVLGTSGGSLQGGDKVDIVNSTSNNGTYTVKNVTFDGIHSFITITTVVPSTTPDGDLLFEDRGGWIESFRYRGISLTFNDTINNNISEHANAVVLAQGVTPGAWDYNYFDIGSFDESLGTIIHLYSTTI